MASMIPIASQEKFDSISPVRSNGQAINVELELRGGDRLPSRRHKPSGDDGDSCANSIATSSSGGYAASDGGDDDRPPPPEVAKTALCVAALALVLAANLVSIATLNRRTPVTKQSANVTHPPLRDITYDVGAMAPQLRRYERPLLVAAELAVVASSAYTLGAVVLAHAHRSIVLRRFCFLLALLFGVRLLTMNVTTLPVSSATLYECGAREPSLAPGVLAARLLDLVAHVGLLSAQAEIRYCGNYVFSGHAVLLVLNCLWADEYGRRRRLGWLLKAAAALGLAALVAAGYDYTISVITAYYATTRLFWIYHTMANNASLKRPDPVNQVCKEWWYPVFRYLEGNVRSVLPSPHKFQ